MPSKDQAQRGRYTRREATHRDAEQRGRDPGERPERLKGGKATNRAGTSTVTAAVSTVSTRHRLYAEALGASYCALCLQPYSRTRSCVFKFDLHS